MRILCFGDSNTYGYDPRSVFGERYAATDRWPEILAAKTRWEIINEGCNGRQIPRSAYPLRLLRAQEGMELFLVMLGTNDLLQGASAREAARQMEHFLHLMLPQCPHILLVAPPPMTRGAWVPTDELAEESRLLAAEYETLAGKLGIPFVDTREWEIELCFDGVHFTEAGNRRFANYLATELKKFTFSP